LARALVRRPKVLLLDEPLSNLDPELRDRVRDDIREIQQRLGITTVLVTHDHSEALAVSDLVVVMRSGEIAESGTPESIYSSPRSTFTAQFLGISNQLPGVIEDRTGAEARVRTDLGPMSGLCADEALGPGDSVMVFARPDQLRLSLREQTADSWKGKVQTATFRGDAWDYRVAVGAHVLRVRTYKARTGPRYGDDVFLDPEPNAALVLRRTDSPEALPKSTHEPAKQTG
jgi:ABC-type Fe3+/spermidine/putrescine transport system ATPase subunit